jgi:hypothetical protein
MTPGRLDINFWVDPLFTSSMPNKELSGGTVLAVQTSVLILVSAHPEMANLPDIGVARKI